MSREIKFRAYDKEAKEYYYNAEYTYDFQCSGRGCYADSFGDLLEHPERYVVEQYTGLKDKNGKDIYEGDVLRFKMHTGKYENYEIVFRDAMFEAINADDTNFISYSTWDFGEVIGNIHENPELLNPA